MDRSIKLVVLSTCAISVFASAVRTQAGDLAPPAGPVTGTMKTLTEVEPRTAINGTNTPGDADSLFKITAPGSYYLTGNITGVAGKSGIEIASSGVTLDLNGFDLLGVTGALDGVSVTVEGLTNIAVVNGSVRSWGGDGIDLGYLFSRNCRIADVLASGNTGNGISASFQCTVSNCSADSNTINGIYTANNCIVSNCFADSNTRDGIFANAGSTVADCTVLSNTLDGIVCGPACVIRGNTCGSNGFNGDGAGIHALSTDTRIEGNNCTGADRGIDVDVAGNFIVRNSCAGNTIDWDIAANNVFGAIIDRRAPASAAVSGFTAASSLGSTDPWANVSY